MKRFAFLLVMLTAVLVAGCDGGSGATSTISVPATPQGATEENIARPTLASSELVVGQERFVFGLLDSKTGLPINDVPEVTIQFFKVHEDGTATKVGDATPIFHSKNLPAGVYVTRTNFDQAGKWGAIMTIKREGQESYQTRANFDVIADSSVPMIGEPAPASKNQTGKDVSSVGDICSAVPQDDMHSLSIAEAVSSGKPTLILIAAPGFCPSFTCGPDLQLVQSLKSKYADKANFIHIEAPNSIQNHTHAGLVDEAHRQEEGHRGVAMPQVKTAEEWGLKSEPWIFLVDREGKIAERLEGGLTVDEVEPAFLKIIQ